MEHLLVTQLALLEALRDYLERGGGSRGSYLVESDAGQETGTPIRFLAENESLRNEIAEIALVDTENLELKTDIVAVRPIPEEDGPFEVMWSAFRSGEVYR